MIIVTALILSDKYKHFMKHNASVEFLEGTTSAGKTTVGAIKFMFKVAQSHQKLHIVSGLDLGVIEKNIVQPDLGILDVFGTYITYWANGNKHHTLPHLEYQTSKGTKIIYLLGYNDKSRWKKALGGQYGCLYIDEINIADMEYVREVFMRADYVMATLNPDDPELPIYKEYINHSRPLKQYEYDAPKEIRDQLTLSPKPDWRHWFFSFEHNSGLTEEKKNQIISSVPVGTKLHKNKILGIRGRSEGLVFSNFEYDKNVMHESEISKRFKFTQFTCGVDTSYSTKSEDTIAFIFKGITEKGELIVLEEMVLNNRDTQKPFAPSDVAIKLHTFLEFCRNKWGLARKVYVDNADQGTMSELRKLKAKSPMVYEFLNSDKRLKVIDRINLMLGWIEKQQYIVASHCNVHIHEMNSYTWKGDVPEDRNDHTINAGQYGWIPLRQRVGVVNNNRQTTTDKLNALRRL